MPTQLVTMEATFEVDFDYQKGTNWVIHSASLDPNDPETLEVNSVTLITPMEALERRAWDEVWADIQSSKTNNYYEER